MHCRCQGNFTFSHFNRTPESGSNLSVAFRLPAAALADAVDATANLETL